MKRFTITLLVALSLLKSNAQSFNYPNVFTDFTLQYRFSSGVHTQILPGVLWCGYNAQTQTFVPQMQISNAINCNFFIRGMGSSGFWAMYKIYQSNGGACSGPMTQVNNMGGFTLIESMFNAPSSLARYAIAGVYDQACFFTTLSFVGVPITHVSFPFPQHSSGLPGPSKPVIAEDVISGDYYIAGSVGGEIYVIKVNSGGNLLWSKNYKLNGIAHFSDLIFCQNGSNKVVVVGSCDVGAGDKDAFIMEIDGQNSSLLNIKSYGQPGLVEEIRSVVRSQDLNGGYVLAGVVENSNHIEEPWILKLDQNLALIWSNTFQSANGKNNGFVDLLERRNTSQNLEHYGLVNSDGGMVVLKLDALGTPFPQTTTNPSNEFLYNITGTANAQASCLSLSEINNPDPGIQVYGTAFNFTFTNTAYMVGAYFNGVASCNYSLSQIPSWNTVNLLEKMPTTTEGPGLSTCSNFSVEVLYLGGAATYPCGGFSQNGSNAREALITGIENAGSESTASSIFPNPVQSQLFLKWTAEEGQNTEIQILNLAGVEVYQQSFNAQIGGDQQATVDFEGLGINSGMYIVNLKNANGSLQRKVAYQR